MYIIDYQVLRILNLLITSTVTTVTVYELVALILLQHL